MTTPAEQAWRVSVEDQLLAVLEDAVVPMSSAQVSRRIAPARSRAAVDPTTVEHLMRCLEEVGRVTRRRPERRLFWEMASGERDERAALRAALVGLEALAGPVGGRGRAGL